MIKITQISAARFLATTLLTVATTAAFAGPASPIPVPTSGFAQSFTVAQGPASPIPVPTSGKSASFTVAAGPASPIPVPTSGKSAFIGANQLS